MEVCGTQERRQKNYFCYSGVPSKFSLILTHSFRLALRIDQNFKCMLNFYMLSLFSISTGPAQSGILSDREVVNLFLHFTVNPKPRVEYIDRPRCCLRGKECCINRFQQVESRWGYSGTSDRIRYLSARGPGMRVEGGQ